MQIELHHLSHFDKIFSPSYRDYFLKFDLFVIIVYFLLSNLNKINLFDPIGSMIQVTEFFFKCLQHLSIIFFVKKKNNPTLW
jgi:hypothetical protein